MGELVRFADVLGRRLSNAVGKDDPQPAPPIERPPEPIPEPLRDPDTPQPVKSPPPVKPPEPVPELPTSATSAAIRALRDAIDDRIQRYFHSIGEDVRITCAAAGGPDDLSTWEVLTLEDHYHREAAE